MRRSAIQGKVPEHRRAAALLVALVCVAPALVGQAGPDELATHRDHVETAHQQLLNIMVWAATGDVERATALLKDNPDLVFSKDEVGNTPLHWAAENDQRDMAEMLLSNKADVNAKRPDGETPLHAAARSGWRDMAELLIAKRATVNAKDNEGRTPLDSVAADRFRRDVAELLIAKGATVNATNDAEPGSAIAARFPDAVAKDLSSPRPPANPIILAIVGTVWVIGWFLLSASGAFTVGTMLRGRLILVPGVVLLCVGLPVFFSGGYLHDNVQNLNPLLFWIPAILGVFVGGFAALNA